jgi:putative phosphotransacetylase
MTDGELDRLAALIAEALLRASREPAGGRAASPERAGTWLPSPVRPEPVARSGEPPVWAGSAQRLDDVAPSVSPEPLRGARSSGGRTTTAELTRAARAAAAGKGSAPHTAPKGRSSFGGRGGTSRRLSITVPIGVSNRHVHLSPEHARALLGAAEPTVGRQISQPGQFAAKEAVAVIGPKGRIEGVRVVGPARGETQLEISLTDARALGVAATVAASGTLADSVGGVTLAGPAGSVTLSRGVIVAARHLHLAPDDAARWGFRDGDRIDVRCGAGARETTFHAVLVRSGPSHATELHLDADEANAAGIRSGDTATIVSWNQGGAGKRALVTEADVVSLARTGGRLPAKAILTPSARDRARALGLLDG